MTGLFSRPAPAAAAPVVTPPPRMPDPLSPDIIAEKAKATAAAGIGGRSSTMLTTPAAAGTLAGSYAGSKLGAG